MKPVLSDKPKRQQRKVRLYVYLARRAPAAVILRTGPSKWTEMIRWDLRKDTFERGQWFHGSIYPERCDISPDGTKFLYFVGQWKPGGIADTWTAISTPPYFTANVLWPVGDTWGGGGHFVSDWHVSVNHGTAAHPDFPAKDYRVESGGGTGETAWMQRNGWTIAEWSTDKPRVPLVWTKESGRLLLTATATDWHTRREERAFTVTRVSDIGKSKPDPMATYFSGHWADWDHNGRLILADHGKLLWAAFNGKLEPAWTLLEDFTADVFQSVPPPEPPTATSKARSRSARLKRA